MLKIYWVKNSLFLLNFILNLIFYVYFYINHKTKKIFLGLWFYSGHHIFPVTKKLCFYTTNLESEVCFCSEGNDNHIMFIYTFLYKYAYIQSAKCFTLLMWHWYVHHKNSYVNCYVASSMKTVEHLYWRKLNPGWWFSDTHWFDLVLSEPLNERETVGLFHLYLLYIDLWVNKRDTHTCTNYSHKGFQHSAAWHRSMAP